MENMLEIDSAMMSYGERDILTDVYLCCRPGDIVGLFGRNGTGKSTLLKMIFGSLKGERKFIRINGKIINRPAYTTQLLSYLPQQPFLPPTITIRQVTSLWIPKERHSEFLGDKFLFKHRDKKVRELSGGEQRYLEIKLLLYNNTPYLLMDEPFYGLSPIASEAIREQVKICSKEKGIIITDHNYREVHKVANRIYLLYDGYLRAIKEEKELIPFGYYPQEWIK